MCGIFGHIGKKQSVDQCIKGLKFLEYRGYDSVGIAGIHRGNLLCYKEKGKIADLEKQLDRKIRLIQSTIGHTRWATHGEASQFNAHPHVDHQCQVAVVHNGIVENYRSLRAMLEEKGVRFSSDTDTEVIAQLVAHLYKGNLIEAVLQASQQMRGFWGLALIHKNHPNQIVATCRESPIIIGVSKKDQEAYVSSDPYAFMRNDLDLFFLKNHEIALLTKGDVQIFDEHAIQVKKQAKILDLPEIEIDKGGYEHFMLKEIFEQPRALQSVLHNRFLLEKGTAQFEDFSLTEKDLKGIHRILILGCGTSWHAGCIAAMQVEELANIPTHAEIASEFRYKHHHVDKHTLVIALSQSGETFDTIAAVRKVKEKGARILAICNIPSSTLMRETDESILLRAGPEISVCSTKAFICQLAILSLVSLQLARLGPMNLEDGKMFLSHLIDLPTIAESVLQQNETIRQLAKTYAHFPQFFFIGRQYMHYASLEAALKLKEISYLNAHGYPAGELKHGPIALIDPNHVVIGLCGNKTTYEKTLSNLAEIKARHGHIIAFCSEDSSEINQIADHCIFLPSLPDPLASIPYSIATQLFAYYIAKERGAEIDQPRNLAKSVTVE